MDITHTSISFTENAFPQRLIIISYFHLLSYKLDWCHEIILLKKQRELMKWVKQCGAPLFPPHSAASVASVWGLSSPPACGGPFLSPCTSLFPGSQASLCIHPSPVHTFARGNFFFQILRSNFSLAGFRVGVFQHKQWQLYLLSSILGNYDSAFIGLFLWQDPFTWFLLLWFSSFYCLNVNHMK